MKTLNCKFLKSFSSSFVNFIIFKDFSSACFSYLKFFCYRFIDFPLRLLLLEIFLSVAYFYFMYLLFIDFRDRGEGKQEEREKY